MILNMIGYFNHLIASNNNIKKEKNKQIISSNYKIINNLIKFKVQLNNLKNNLKSKNNKKKLFKLK